MPPLSLSDLKSKISRRKAGILCKACNLVNLDVLFSGPRMTHDTHGTDEYKNFQVLVNSVGGILKSKGCPLCELLKFVIFEANPQLPKKNGYLFCAAGKCPPEAIDWD